MGRVRAVQRQAFVAVGCHRDLEASLHEDRAHGVSHLVIVIDNQDAVGRVAFRFAIAHGASRLRNYITIVV